MKLSTKRKKPRLASVVQLPKYGFDHPFYGEEDHMRRYHGKEYPTAIAQLRMCALSNYIREKPSWWDGARDMVVVEKWREEALRREEEALQRQEEALRRKEEACQREEEASEREEREEPWRKLTPTMVSYVLEELQGYASLRDPETGVEVGPAERIWKSDKLIPASLREKLLAAVAPLETVLDYERDPDPDSDGFAVNLVNPALYPIVYGHTVGKLPGTDSVTILVPPEFRGGDPKFVSRRFQLLPSDFSVDGDGNITLISPYINNVHPIHHKELYSVILEILQHALPMFERVLSDLLRSLPRKVESSVDYESQRTMTVECSKKAYKRDLEVMNNRLSLKGQTLQVIVRLTNIMLTPERSEYPGGEWRVEGLRNEMIVSGFIYYYDSENIGKSRLSFRRATWEPLSATYDRADAMHMKELYDMDEYSPCVQDIGDVITKTHRCVAFPNLYQHRVQPFRLQDPTKPGHRKILAFFLVDPTHMIPSATDVGPQQREWVTEVMCDAGQNSAFANLPTELLEMILTANDGLMTRSEAEKYREELVSERVLSVKENTRAYFGAVGTRYWTHFGD